MAAETEAAKVRTATGRPPANPATRRPPARPNPRPRTGPMERPAGRTTGPQATRTATRPAVSPAAAPGRTTPRQAGKATSGQGRQRAAMRLAVIATSGLLLVGVASALTEIHLHGFAFFVFRSTGTGETGPSGLQEDQGPGQPDAPKPAHTTVIVHQGQ
jgi:hypothetical protein